MSSTKFKMRGITRGYGDILMGDKTEKTDDEIAPITDDDLKKIELGIQMLAREGYMELVMSMQDIKSFNIVKEHENMLYNAWSALQDEFEPTTPEALIEEIEEYNESKLHDVKVNMIEIDCRGRVLFVCTITIQSVTHGSKTGSIS